VPPTGPWDASAVAPVVEGKIPEVEMRKKEIPKNAMETCG
jgi:hypothetical protein